MLDRSTIIGFITGFSLILAAIMFQGELIAFASLSSFLIVTGGITAATMINYSFENIKESFAAITGMISIKSADLRTDMEILSLFARRARTEGMLSLDSDIQYIEDPFLQDGLQLAIDGFKEESLERILDDELKNRERQIEVSINVMDSMSAYSPAFGMIGTVIGMVLMLQNVSDPEQLGAGLSVALLTTLYGIILANMLLGPLAGKLEYLKEMDLNRKRMFRVAVLSMVENENPRITEKKMLMFIDPKSRAEFIKFHENVRVTREKDEKIYTNWMEYQHKEWDVVKEIVKTGS